MGHFRHDVAVAIGYGDDGVRAFQALRAQMPRLTRCFLRGPFTAANCNSVFIMIPDGSKEGWDLSDAVDHWRERFVAVAARYEWDVLHVGFGGDFPEPITTRVMYTSDDVAEVMPGACHPHSFRQ